MKRTIFHIKGMDCSSEEQMIRMRLESVEGVTSLKFDLAERRLSVFHDGSRQAIGEVLESLNLRSSQVAHTEDVELPMKTATR